MIAFGGAFDAIDADNQFGNKLSAKSPVLMTKKVGIITTYVFKHFLKGVIMAHVKMRHLKKKSNQISFIGLVNSNPSL